MTTNPPAHHAGDEALADPTESDVENPAPAASGSEPDGTNSP